MRPFPSRTHEQTSDMAINASCGMLHAGHMTMTTVKYADFRPGGTGVNDFGETYDECLVRLLTDPNRLSERARKAREAQAEAVERKTWTDRQWGEHLYSLGHQTRFPTQVGLKGVLEAVNGAPRTTWRLRGILAAHWDVCAENGTEAVRDRI